MIAIKMLINRLKTKYSSDEIAVLLILFSIFISVYAVGVCIFTLVIYLIASGRIKEIFLGIKNSIILMILPVIAIITSAIYGSILEIGMAVGIAFILVAGIYIRYVMTKKLFDDIIELSCFLSILIFIIALIQVLYFHNPMYRAESVFLNANYYATIIEIVAIFTIYKLIDKKRKYSVLYYIFVFCVNLVGLVLSQCRTSFAIILLLIPVLFILLNKKKYLFIYLGFMVSIIILVFMIPEILPRVETVDGDIAKRLLIWKAAISSIGDRPFFGGGCLTYMRVYLLYGGIKANHAHNIFLEIILNYGIIGSAFAISYFFSNVKELFKIYIKGIDKERSSIAIIIVFVVLIHGMLDATFFWPQTGVFILAIIACPGIYEKEKPALNNAFKEIYDENLDKGLKPKL